MTGYKIPPTRRTVNIPTTGLHTNLAILADRYRDGLSWAAIGAEIGLSGAMVYRAVVHQKYPGKLAYRRALGLVPPRKPRRRRKARNRWHVTMQLARLTRGAGV